MHTRMQQTATTLAALFLMVSAAGAHTFSIDRDSEVAIAGDLLSADVLTPGPTVHVDYAVLGLVWDDSTGTGDDLNALSAGRDSFAGPPILFFSVDRDSIGIDGSPFIPYVSDVYEEARSGQAAGDVFVTCLGHPGVPAWSPPSGQNMLHVNQQEIGLHPSLFPTQDYTGTEEIDDLDALNFSEFDLTGDTLVDESVYFSLDLASTSLSAAVGAEDVLVVKPGDATFSVFADGVTDIGLQEGDDIDALVLVDIRDRGERTAFADRAFFSLAPGSPTLAAYGYSAADIFYTNFNGQFVREFTAEQMGLLSTDNIDALEAQPGSEPIPEPGTLLLIGTGCLTAFGYLRRRRMT